MAVTSYKFFDLHKLIIIIMEQSKQELVIILPEGMKDVPVRIVRDDQSDELNIEIVNLTETRKEKSPSTEKQHVLIWHQNEYEHLSLDAIMWIEANSSYCCIHATENRKFTMSYPLARIEERLPKSQFIRIQRSYLVNIEHVKKLAGQSLIIGNHILKIGEGYKEEVLNRFIFLGVRGSQPREAKNVK
jgi:DNA-binding LytR/AlgR family response regulator